VVGKRGIWESKKKTEAGLDQVVHLCPKLCPELWFDRVGEIRSVLRWEFEEWGAGVVVAATTTIFCVLDCFSSSWGGSSWF